MTTTVQKPTLLVRSAVIADIPGIIAMMTRAYLNLPAYTASMLRGQIATFPEGQFVALRDGTIIAYSASFRIAEDVALSDHTWTEITGGCVTP